MSSIDRLLISSKAQAKQTLLFLKHSKTFDLTDFLQYRTHFKGRQVINY